MPLPQHRCPICNSWNRTELPYCHEWSDVRWQLVRCRACGHRYTDPVPTDGELTRMYADEYFDDGGAWVCGFWSGSYVSNEVNLRREARGVLRRLPAHGGRLLEIGAAGGYFLDEARTAGYDVLGIELNRTMADWGRSHLGVDIICERFESAELPEGSFDAIVAQDVLEHVREPRTFVGRVARLLSPGGIFLVCGPLEQSWKDRIYVALRRWRHRGLSVNGQPPYHLQGFVRQSFRHVVESAGLSLTSFRATTCRPRVDLSSPKAIVASAIELGAYEADLVTANGDFMVGCATRGAASGAPSELP